MEILIIHLSDFHFRPAENNIFNYTSTLISSIKDAIGDSSAIFIVCTGDIAYSGKEAEYKSAEALFHKLLSEIKSSCNMPVFTIFVPGNHDLDHSRPLSLARLSLLGNLPTEKFDQGIFTILMDPQEQYQRWAAKYDPPIVNILYQDAIYKRICITLSENITILFNCYNTAWSSSKDEKYGLLDFPLHHYADGTFESSGYSCVISCLHHPTNWYGPDRGRNFAEHLINSSDIILAGHEHSSSDYKKELFGGTSAIYQDGGVLQDYHLGFFSSFNTLKVDLTNRRAKSSTYELAGDLYRRSSSEEWISYSVNGELRKNRFEIARSFLDWLEDTGAVFSHSRMGADIKLEDIYVSPNLSELQKKSDDDKNAKRQKIFNLTTLLRNDLHDKHLKFLIVGGERSGKTSLCKWVYKHYHKLGYVPVYIEGGKAKSLTLESLRQLIISKALEQYSSLDIDRFRQLPPSKKLIIFDDFHKSPLNIKHKAKLIQKIESLGTNVLIIGNELFQVEALAYEEREKIAFFSDYKKYSLMQFGHKLRYELINRWNSLGREDVVQEDELARSNDESKKIVDTVISKNLVPSYPLFLLILLQAQDAGKKSILNHSSYAYYYHYLINSSLEKEGVGITDFHAYENYIANLAYYCFAQKCSELTEENLIQFHVGFTKEYSITTMPYARTLEVLLRSKILRESGNYYKFMYSYVFYYFVGKYFADHLTKTHIKSNLQAMCERLYREEFANVILFITHHTKDPYVLDILLHNAKLQFQGLEPARIEKEIEPINKLKSEIERHVLENIDVEENRKEALARRDDIEGHAGPGDGRFKDDLDYDLGEDIPELGFVTKLNLAIKNIEILGQILRNYYGSLPADAKLSIGTEAYNVGMRSLGVFYTMLAGNVDVLVTELRKHLEENKIVLREKVHEAATDILFDITTGITFAFIKKITESIGTDRLEGTYDEILKHNDSTAFKLIDFSIRLGYFKNPSTTMLRAIRKQVNGNYLAESVLRHTVIDYLYMFPVERKDKQRICNEMGIDIVDQRYIEATTQRLKA